MQSPVNEFIYQSDQGNPNRLDQYVAHIMPDLTRSSAQKLIKSEFVLVNGSKAKPSLILQPGDIVRVIVPPAESTDIVAEDIPLDVVFEDEHLLVINKPKGMTVHPACGHSSGTLVNAVLGMVDELSGVGGVERPGIVHRLDKDTSGLLVVAKTDKAHVSLQEQIQNRTVSRRYYALVWGNPKFEEAEVDAPIGRNPNDRQKMAVITDTSRYTARKALTRLMVLENFKGFAFLEAALHTGRTHQIRVHCSFIGHPVVGDIQYGGMKRAVPQSYSRLEQEELRSIIEGLAGQLLHAHSLSFIHPVTGETMSFDAPLPDEFTHILDWLRTHPK